MDGKVNFEIIIAIQRITGTYLSISSFYFYFNIQTNTINSWQPDITNNNIATGLLNIDVIVVGTGFNYRQQFYGFSDAMNV